MTVTAAASTAQQHQLFIDNAYGDSSVGSTLDVYDPTTGEILVVVAAAAEADVDRAVRSARRALGDPSWRLMAPAARGRLVARLGTLLQERADEFVALESLDTGKPRSRAAMIDIPAAIRHFEYFAGWADKIQGDSHATDSNTLVYTRKEPVGVVAAIIPWNFPLMMAAWKLAPALTAGCTVILKPAEETPLTALLLGELVVEAGFPPGVVNILPGTGIVTGAALCRHEGVDKVAFTGSTEVGREILRASAGSNLKKVHLELGGKSPNIVLPDADLELAVVGVSRGIFGNSGQICTAGSRLFVHDSIFDEFLDGVTSAAKAQKVGGTDEPAATMGPLISKRQLDRVRSYVDGGVEEGANLHTGGGTPPGVAAGGYFYEPTVLVCESDQLTVMREEIFGPVLCASPYETLEEVAARANDTPYGLAAGVWTRDVAKAHKLAGLLQAGSVWVNTFNRFDPAIPFGGFKQSGQGREHGRLGLEQYLETKSVWVDVTTNEGGAQ